MKIEILSIVEDYVTKTIFTSALLNGLLVLVAPIVEADRRNFTRELNVFFSEDVVHICEEERWHTVSLQKFISEIYLGAAIDRFLRSAAQRTNRFPLPLTPLSLSQNRTLEHLPAKGGCLENEDP